MTAEDLKRIEAKTAEAASIICADCGEPFGFPPEEQREYEANGYHRPSRCVLCRRARRYEREERAWTDTICSDCGTRCVVPFVPAPNRSVYCDACLAKNRGAKHP